MCVNVFDHSTAHVTSHVNTANDKSTTSVYYYQEVMMIPGSVDHVADMLLPGYACGARLCDRDRRTAGSILKQTVHVEPHHRAT